MHCQWQNCCYESLSEEDLFLHAIRAHTNQKDKKPSCNWLGCNYVTTNRYRLKTHLKSHFSVKNYECRACGLQYKHRYNLSRHIRAAHNNISCELSPNDALYDDAKLVREGPYAVNLGLEEAIRIIAF
eukprot:NODE_501_length_6715_cov_0.718259.p5 type:complete len:128 gc:universal NODE_501_length_6715_cov_0.718259:710-327(-)